MHTINRATSRVLLCDELDRLLLICGRDPRSTNARWWYTVGGGVETGESFIQAAVREVQEETATALDPRRLSPLVLTRNTRLTVDATCLVQYEEYRFARLTHEEVQAMHIDSVEAPYGHRWWSMEELRTPDAVVRPKSLPSVLPGILSGAHIGYPPFHLGDFDENTDPD